MINKILYKTVGLGGTFDHFHDGHKTFIRYASSFSKELVIGISNKKMTLSKPFNKTIESFNTRLKNVKKFCHQENIKVKVFELKDLYGPTIEKKSVEAIVCTTNTQKGAIKINEVRSKMKMKILPIHIHNLLYDKENIAPISSSRIRKGEIDRSGTCFANIINHDLHLNQNQRNYFSKPQGKIVAKPIKPPYFICVVGDTTLEKFVKNNWQYDLGIFDGRRNRVTINSKILNSLQVDQQIINSPGLISEELSNILQKWNQNREFKHIFVKGEEDLSAVALALTLPLGSCVYYGQPDMGIVEMKVTENLKRNVFEVLFH